MPASEETNKTLILTINKYSNEVRNNLKDHFRMKDDVSLNLLAKFKLN